MNTFIKVEKKIFHTFFFHKSLRKNVPICHIAATPLTNTFADKNPKNQVCSNGFGSALNRELHLNTALAEQYLVADIPKHL